MGRHAFYKTPQQMQARIDDYFEVCKGTRKYSWINKRGEHQTANLSTLPDWTGLALHLGFASRFSLNDYIDRKKTGNETKDILLPGADQLSFAHILARAKSKIEMAKKQGAELGIYNERMILADLAANHKYNIKQDVNVSGNINVTVQDSFKRDT